MSHPASTESNEQGHSSTSGWANAAQGLSGAKTATVTGHELKPIPSTERRSGGKRQWAVQCSCGWGGPWCKNRLRALDHAVKHHVEAPAPPPKPTCPTPGKRKFRSQSAADRELGNFWKSCPKGAKRLPIRVYKCPCGYWHMTKRPERDR